MDAITLSRGDFKNKIPLKAKIFQSGYDNAVKNIDNYNKQLIALQTPGVSDAIMANAGVVDKQASIFQLSEDIKKEERVKNYNASEFALWTGEIINPGALQPEVTSLAPLGLISE